eukprot:35157-Chlamydomonas_euryale.AAC.1
MVRQSLGARSNLVANQILRQIQKEQVIPEQNDEENPSPRPFPPLCHTAKLGALVGASRQQDQPIACSKAPTRCRGSSNALHPCKHEADPAPCPGA